MSSWLELYVKVGLYCHTFAIVGKDSDGVMCWQLGDQIKLVD